MLLNTCTLQAYKNVNEAWILPEQVQEDQFSQGHVSTAVSPHNQGVFVEGTKGL